MPEGPNYLRNPYLITLNTQIENRGILTSIEFAGLPCKVRRVFMLSVNDVRYSRGGHAHKVCWQILVSLDSEVKVDTQNSFSTDFFVLKRGFSLVIPPLNWLTIQFTEAHSSLLVLASHPYDPGDYIYDKDILFQENKSE